MAESTPPERKLEGGWEQDALVERDGILFRKARPQSEAVLALLRHLADSGFPASPRVIEPGLRDGKEMVSFIEGEVDHRPWTEPALVELGTLVRQLHDTTRRFPASDLRWRPTFVRDLPAEDRVIGHGDLGPWNIVSRDGKPVGFIDWDTAGPIGSTWDLAYVAWLNVQLHDDDVAERQGLGDAASRARHLRVFLDAYGMPRSEREAFVLQLAEIAIHEARDEAVKAGITRDTDAAVLDNGYPILWAITWRARSASWILTHRGLLAAAVV